MPPKQTFSISRIHSLRDERGLTQAEFAEKIGYTRQMVSAVERGRTDPSLKYLKSVARVFNVDLAYFWE